MYLKSNMDRFIVLKGSERLKSNMDRFIDIADID